MKLESYDMCQGCGRSNIVGKLGLCLMCYVNRNDLKLEDIKKKARFAKGWLDENRGHKKFDVALKRYEDLIHEIKELGGEEI